MTAANGIRPPTGGGTLHRGGPVVHVVGARPNFMKAAPVVQALARRGIPQRLVHTGQHYDAAMSDVFFTELGLPAPDTNLNVGSGSQAEQTAALLVRLEAEFLAVRPELVVVYGDVNSTLAAAIVAAKLGLPLAHVEAGLRSFDNTMPEEINRRVTDLLSNLLFTTSSEAGDNLAAAGVDPRAIHFVGNPMIDTLLANLHRLDADGPRTRLGLPERYALATIHRPSNVDDLEQARRIVRMLDGASQVVPFVVPLHPRGRAMLQSAGLQASERIHVVEPMGYLEFMSLVRGAAFVVTDSGGVQEETTILGVRCFTVRPNTERPVTITHGTNRLMVPEEVPAAAATVANASGAIQRPADMPRPPLWDGHASERIVEVIATWLAEPGVNAR